MHLVLCRVAFFGYSIRPGLVATRDEVHREECMAKNGIGIGLSIDTPFGSGNSHLIGSQDSERIDDLLGSVCVGVLACHEVEEGVEVHEAGAVGIDNCQNALEV